MERAGVAVKALLTFVMALGLHHRFHGPPIDYLGLAAASAASWIGVPGPGEPVLIATAVFAARHRLDIGSVLVIAWLGAAAGGIGGWLIGMRAGRAVLTTRGPLRRMRLNALARGDQIFERYTVIAVLLVPSWIAGVHRVRAGVYLPTNAIAAAVWALGIGLGAYLVGPTVLDFVQDLGTITTVGLVVLILGALSAEFVRRRRLRGTGDRDPDQEQ